MREVESGYRFIHPNTTQAGIPSAIVDVNDYEFLKQFTWHVTRKKGTHNYYYHTRIKRNVWVKMHRMILGLTDPKIYVDHINHVTYDNRRDNLRVSNDSMNAANRRKNNGCLLPYKGVSKNYKKYHASINVNGKYIYIGNSDDMKIAAQLYNDAATKYFGEYACLNDI